MAWWVVHPLWQLGRQAVAVTHVKSVYLLPGFEVTDCITADVTSVGEAAKLSLFTAQGFF